jgi:hypothetical protein
MSCQAAGTMRLGSFHANDFSGNAIHTRAVVPSNAETLLSAMAVGSRPA